MCPVIPGKCRLVLPILLTLSVGLWLPGAARAAEPELKVGLARAKITPDGPIRMAGYGSRNKPSEGVLADLFAKAMAIEDSEGERAVLLTSDVIGYNARVADLVCRKIMEKTGLERRQILLNPSHTHTGPVIGVPGSTGYGLEGEEAERVHQYTAKLAGTLATLAADALADRKPARLSWGIGVTHIVMNRREFTERGVRLGFNPRGYVDRGVPVLRVDSPEGELRALVFVCACHNTTLGGNHYEICGDYAGFAQAHVEGQLPGVQAMFMIGCGGSANPYPRGTVEAAQQNGQSLGAEVCRMAAEKLAPVRGPFSAALEYADLPLAPVPPRGELEEMAKGPSYLAYNAKRMIEALDRGESLPTVYPAPIAVWQFGDDLTLVGLPGEVVGGYVPLVEDAIGHRKLWVAGYANDDFGYLPSKRVLAEGGYETRGLIPDVGFFAPEVEDAVVAKVRRMAEKAGRTLPE
ncbi:MAG TPA: neutral/alkaline non-lysosomal ceramidase N-terminal domain-containing protein [Thermoguttaceae bacterium]|nr:neutral/alkaline non-lysosomal ceramidase N-terminal domain-containing protein [Thermoguttaceae bacterium]